MRSLAVFVSAVLVTCGVLPPSVRGQCNVPTAAACAANFNTLYAATPNSQFATLCPNYTVTATCFTTNVPQADMLCVAQAGMDSDISTFFTNSQNVDSCCGGQMASVLSVAGITPLACGATTTPAPAGTCTGCCIPQAAACCASYNTLLASSTGTPYNSTCSSYTTAATCVQTNIPASNINCAIQASGDTDIMGFFTNAAQPVDDCCGAPLNALLVQLGILGVPTPTNCTASGNIPTTSTTTTSTTTTSTTTSPTTSGTTTSATPPPPTSATTPAPPGIADPDGPLAQASLPVAMILGPPAVVACVIAIIYGIKKNFFFKVAPK